MDKRTSHQDNIVSFEDDELILVDKNDIEIGFDNKKNCHDGEGLLHRAFSLFIFNDQKELLLQQRSAQKRLWPLYWSNSCCSHPRRGESMEQAIHRRLQQELGLTSELNYVYKFQYQVSFEQQGSENELCSVYIGKSTGEVRSNINEIAAWRYVTLGQLQQELEQSPEQFTPWFKMEWETLTDKYREQLEQFI